MQKKYFFKNQIYVVLVVWSIREFFARFLTAVFIVKNDVKNDQQQRPHFVFRLRSNRGGD